MFHFSYLNRKQFQKSFKVAEVVRERVESDVKIIRLDCLHGYFEAASHNVERVIINLVSEKAYCLGEGGKKDLISFSLK